MGEHLVLYLDTCVSFFGFFFGHIYSIKTLVKSYLPVKDAHLRGGIDDLIEILRIMLSFGDFSKELESRYGGGWLLGMLFVLQLYKFCCQ